MIRRPPIFPLFPYSTLFLFFFNDTATTEIYTLSLHDALPISTRSSASRRRARRRWWCVRRMLPGTMRRTHQDRKSTRLNSSHLGISYAVFCLKKKEHTSELQSLRHLVCRLLLEKKKNERKNYFRLFTINKEKVEVK